MGCARRPAPAVAPRPAASPAATTAPAGAAARVPHAGAPDLAGQWEYTARLGSSTVEGTLTLVRSGASYVGGATATVADEPVPMISLAWNGAEVVMLFDTPRGEARIEGTVSGGTLITGTVTLGDRVGTFRARKHQ